MKYSFTLVLFLFLTACTRTHYGIRDKESDESYDSYIQSVVDFNGGYKPADFKCPHGYDIEKFGDGFICPYWVSEWETEDTLMWVEILIYISLFAILITGG